MIETLPDAMLLLAAAHTPSGGGGNMAVHSTDSLLLAAEGDVGTQTLTSWIKDNVFAVIILAIACVAGMGAMRQNASKVITVAALSVVVLMLVGIAGSAATQQTVQQWALSLIGL
ncbi:hypothetical protein AB4Z55_00135 [Gordonia sp. ABKF26]|uniref:hypothetical protein n=1 Tax=Gordonia sp. ABKF26 TaxID=3238687 RepID=UPI0034E53F6B